MQEAARVALTRYGEVRTHEPGQPLHAAFAGALGALGVGPAQRDEWLGDCVLDLAVSDYLYERYPAEREGFLTKLRAKLVNNARLAELCDECGLAAGLPPAAVKQEVFESFVCGIFRAHGYAAARSWVVALLESCVDMAQVIAGPAGVRDELATAMAGASLGEPVLDTHKLADGGYAAAVSSSRGLLMGAGTGTTQRRAEAAAMAAAVAYCGNE